MENNVEDFEERRQKAIAEKERRKRAEWRSKAIDLNKDDWVKVRPVFRGCPARRKSKTAIEESSAAAR